MKRLLVLFVLVVASVSANGAAPGETPVILVFGDSISAGYGLARVDQGWVALLQTRLRALGYGYQVVNASVSGETTAGGLARLPRALALHQPRIVILSWAETTDFAHCRSHKCAATSRAWSTWRRRRAPQVLLLGMRMPPNYGPEFTERFSASYVELARDRHLAPDALPARWHRPVSGPHASRRNSSQ